MSLAEPSIVEGVSSIHESPPHVEYILLAEFDIGIGSSLTHQYPKKTDMPEQILAEMMLPDGVHQRSEDWTIFFLNQSPNTKVETVTDKDGSFPEVEPKNLIYVLSLVVTKHDREAVRGAHVKAMAICTRHRYLHIYQPVLLLALENYFKNPSIEVLKTLYQAVNAMDVSLMPKFSMAEKMILRASENKDMFEEKFIAMEEQANLMKELNQLSINSNSTADSAGKRPGIPGNLNEGTKRQTFIDLSSGLRKEIQSGSNKNRDRHYFETLVNYDKHKIPIRVPLTIFPEEVGDFSLIHLINTFANAPIIPHPFHPHLDTAGPNTHPLIILLNALLTEKRVIFLGHGLPSGQVANYVLAACAMASGSGIVLKGFLERAFPYTSLSDIDALLKFRGFIAGVANPTFEGHPKWWDVLCNISTGKIVVSQFIQSSEMLTSTKRSSHNSFTPLMNPNDDDSSINSFDPNHTRQPSNFNPLTPNPTTSTHALNFTSPNPTSKEKNSNERWDNSDNEFIQEVLQAILNHYGELSIRAKFADYIQRFVGIAALYEEEIEHAFTRIGITQHNTPDPTPGKLLGYGVVFTDDVAKQREIQANLPRIEGWRHTLSYCYYIQDFQRFLKTRVIQEFNPQRQISKLRIYKSISEKELEAIYKAFLDFVVTSDQIIEFLAAVPQNQGGLTPLTVALFHPSKVIRNYTVQFLNRIDQHQTGTRFIQNLNLFHKLAYERQCLAYEVNDSNFKVLQPYVHQDPLNKVE